MTNFFKRVFFSPTQEEFLPPFFFYFFFASAQILQTCTETASNVNHFVDSVWRHRMTHLRGKSTTAGNSTYPKGGVSCSKDTFVVNGSSVFQIKFCGKNPALRVAANR